MDKTLRVSKSIVINSNASDVWDALTNPEKIKRYLFGTETITDWKIGSPIIFQGSYEGTTYKDKGNVLEIVADSHLKYDYWSGFSGLEDKPEHYSTVSYHIEVISEGTVKLTWTQAGFASKEGQQHSENGLPAMLEQIKKLVEEG